MNRISQLTNGHYNLEQPYRGPDTSFLSRFTFWSWVVLLVAALLQCLLFGSSANIIAVGCVLGAWLLTTITILRPSTLMSYPLSSFLIIGFVCTQFYFPSLFTLLEGKPLVYNLLLPEDVFLHSILALIVLLITHSIYYLLTKQTGLSSQAAKPLERLGFFTAPTDLQVWLMGLFGMGAMFYSHFMSTSLTRQESGVLSKVIWGFISFAYAPYFIPFGKLYGRRGPTEKTLPLKLIVYTGLLFLISMGANSRGAFMIGFTSVGFAFGLGSLLGELKARLLTIKNICAALLGIWLFTGPIADIGTAMVMVRGLRDDVPKAELISLTLEAFTQKEAIRAYRIASSSKGADWDEDYLNNIFLARFCNLKYNDASLILATKLGSQNLDMYNYTIEHLISSIPEPFLKALGVSVNKSRVNTSSFGDYLYYKVSADFWALGGYRTGHFAGTGMAAFGWWYLLLLGIGMLPVFMLYDILFQNKRSVTPVDNAGGNSMFRFSLCGLVSLTSIFRFLPAESIEEIAAFLLRGWIQMILLYAITYHLTRYLSASLSIFVRPQVGQRQLIR